MREKAIEQQLVRAAKVVSGLALKLPRHGYSWMANRLALLPRDMRPTDSYVIAVIMARLEGWENKGMRQSLPIYGLQCVYERVN